MSHRPLVRIPVRLCHAFKVEPAPGMFKAEEGCHATIVTDTGGDADLTIGSKPHIGKWEWWDSPILRVKQTTTPNPKAKI